MFNLNLKKKEYLFLVSWYNEKLLSCWHKIFSFWQVNKKLIDNLIIILTINKLISSQNCILEFQSWARDRLELVVNDGKDNLFINHTYINTEWNILNVSVNEREDNRIVYLEFIILLKRNHAFYGKYYKVVS